MESELAFEEGIDHDSPPNELWCVRSWLDGMRGSFWVTTELQAKAKAERLGKRGEKVVSIKRYVAAADVANAVSTNVQTESCSDE